MTIDANCPAAAEGEERYAPAPAPNTYRQILKATTFIGGAQVINIGFAMLRNKILAVVLGPAGVGLAGLYTSVTTLVGTVAGLGIPMSGVRQVADAAGKNDQRRVAATVATLKAVTWIGGLVGMVALIAFANPIARFAFRAKSTAQSAAINYRWGLSIVAAVVLLEALAANQRAVLQGLRRIGELSMCQVLGAVGGTIAALPLVFMFREQGVAGFLVVAAACGTLASWWFVRRLGLERVKLTRQEFVSALHGLLNVGAAVLTMGIVGAVLNFLLRIVVERGFGTYGVGLFQATFALSTTYVTVVLTAMGTDFYPRLTAVSGDTGACNRLINEQTEMGLLIALPGVLATLVLAPWILHAVYAAEFVAATDIIRWQILGVAMQVVSWPLGYIALAKGRGGLFVLTEGSFAALLLALLYLCIKWRQLEGVGMAFFFLHVLYLPAILLVARSLTGFSWSRSCLKTLLVAMMVTGGVFLLCRYGRPAVALPVGLLATVLAGLWSLKQLQHMLGKDFIQHAGRSIARRFGWKRERNP